MQRRTLLLIGVPLLAILIGAGGWYATATAPTAPPPDESDATKSLPGTIELADTQAKRVQGLSGRTSVPDDYGMLFIFDEESTHGFWMKDMQVAIDIIWINAEGRIVHIAHDATPNSYPKVFEPLTPSRYVLETRAGYAKDHGWKVGTTLDLSGVVK